MADKRKNRVFKTERKDIEYPLWRKKVDASIFYDKAIHIPKFAKIIWDIPSQFKGISSKKDPRSSVKIDFEEKSYEGHVTELKAKNRKETYRLFINQDLADILKQRFLMSFMRDLEFKLGDYDKDPKNRKSIEDVIPFNEFLDIEYNSDDKQFIFNAHYTQQAVFKNLFNKILDTTVFESIESELEGKSKTTILKGNWLPKSHLSKTPDQPNVIYYLLDQKNKEIYIGEAKNLISRLSGHRPEIPEWTHFRFNVLPPSLEPYRVAIERMIIRDFAMLLPSIKSKASPKKISEYVLKNKKVDS